MRRAGKRGWGRRAVLPSALAMLAATFLLVALPEPATAHTGDYILSVPAAEEVFVDGNITGLEWSEATSVNLAGIPGNGLEAFLRVKHNDSFLFVALDVVGDTSESSQDFSLVAFDTGHDGLTTVGGEDIFYHAGFFAGEQAHFVSDGVSWSPHDSPYDESLPNHTGLASARGFGPSDLSPELHGQFEFRIPLPLLGAAVGDTLGILAVVGDYDTQKLSFWPENLLFLELDGYGDLVLIAPAAANDLLLLPPSRIQNALAGDLVPYQLNVTNRGTSGTDTFDLTANSPWAVTFWDSAGTTPLADTNGDGDPDTGALFTGESALVVAKVQVPADATGRNEAMVTATSWADANVSRSALLITNLPPALFRPPHSDYGNDTDVPADGLFNYLIVQANLTVAVSGSYFVQGTLYDRNFTSPISFAGRSVGVTAGNQTAALLFSGGDVYRSRTNGPYAVDLRIFDDGFPSKELDRSNHTTQPYAYTDFQKPAAVFAPPHSDFGLDTDGDGLFNHLVVDASIDVADAGTFLVDAVLRDPTYRLFIYTSNVTTLDVGLQTVPLWFDGVRINASDIDGPYTVELTLYDYDTFAFLDSDTHTTASYSHLDFEGPPASFVPPHSDVGLDTDGNGLFDYLVVDASVQVDEAGMFLVDAVLRDPTYSLFIYTSNVTTLDAGLQTVPLWFDGIRVNASDIDGPYTVDLTLYDYTTFQFLDSDTYETANYSHLEFESPLAALAPSHSDFGLDTDGDGLFNHLVVDVNIQVEEAGMYYVDAFLHDPSFALTLWTSNVTTLDVGLQTVPLWFDGEAIRVSGVDGPYTVDLTLYDYENFTFLDSDTHETAAYSHLDFDEPFPTFRIGTILPLTGSLEFFGRSMRDAADLAAADINAAGGVLGIMLELLHRDSQTSPFAGADSAAELIFGEGVPAIIGAASSSVSLAVADLTVSNEVVQISPSSTSPVFTTIEPEEPGWFWRTASSDALQGKVAALRAIERGWTRVGVLAVANPYGIGLAESFRENFVGDGRGVVQVDYTEVRPDYTSDLQLIADAAPDAVFFIGYPGDGLTIMQNWWASKDQPGWDWNWLFSEGLRSADFMFDLQNAGIDVSGAEGVAPVLEGPNYEAFRTEYLNQYGREPEIFDAHTYDALYLTALAAVAGQAVDSLSIRDNLISVANPPGTVIGPGPGEFERAIGILEAGGEIDYEGASSRVNFDQVGDVGSSFEVWQVTPDYEILQIDLIPESQIWPPSLDSTPPTVAISSPLAGTILLTGDVLVSWTANDLESGIDRIEVSLDDGMPVSLVATETTHTFTGVADGSHTIAAGAFDVAGNSQIASVDFTVDTTPPTTSITSPSSGAFVAASSVQVLWTASDITSGIDSFEVSLDDGMPVVLPATASGHTFPGVADGSHTVTVVAFDVADHSLAASVDFTVDTVAPTVSLLSPSAAIILTSSNVDVAWTASDVTSGIDQVEVSLDGGMPLSLEATATSYTFTGVADGSHTITVTVLDHAGNSATASIDTTLDTNPFSPTGPYGSGPVIGTIAAVIVTVLVLLLILRRRGGSRPKMPRTRGPPKKGEEALPTDDATGQIRELKKLRDEGLVTEEEFRAKEEELLSRR